MSGKECTADGEFSFKMRTKRCEKDSRFDFGASPGARETVMSMGRHSIVRDCIRVTYFWLRFVKCGEMRSSSKSLNLNVMLRYYPKLQLYVAGVFPPFLCNNLEFLYDSSIIFCYHFL